MFDRLDALGREVEATLDVPADAVDVAALEQLLAERDALLRQLTAALTPAASTPAVTDALAHAGESTAALIAKVAERTDALRQALRTLDRGTRAANAYQPASGVPGQVNARR